MTMENTLSSLNCGNIGSISNSALDIWYNSIKDIPLWKLSVGDVARAIRQELQLQYILPVAFVYLEKDILSGEQYDGELASAVSRIPTSFWNTNKHMMGKAISILSKDISVFDDDIKDEINVFIRKSL